MADVSALLAMPVSDRSEAESFIGALADLGLAYHFDDGAVDCLHGNGHVTREEAVQIDEKINAAYEAWRESGADLMVDCPIGHLIKVCDL